MISSMINAKVSKRNIQDFSAKIDFISEEEMKIESNNTRYTPLN